MLTYLSKFVLQMLPTISATVIGAYIVATWINPKTPSDPARIAARLLARQPAEVTPAVERPVQGDLTEDTKPGRGASAPEHIRIIPIVKQPASVNNAPANAPAAVTTPGPAVDARRNANELARAAIQRMRGGSEIARESEEPATPASPAVRVQHARVVAAEAPQAVPAAPAVSAPPLPPAVTIAPLRSPQGELADERPTPPGEIPSERNPLSLQASHRVVENLSPADEFLNATRSFFRALTLQ